MQSGSGVFRKRCWPANRLKPNKTLILFSDRKSTRLNSSHTVISYAVFCLKKKTPTYHPRPGASFDDGVRNAGSASERVTACEAEYLTRPCMDGQAVGL